MVAGLINSGIEKPTLRISKQDSAVNFNNNVLKIFSAGQKRLIADILWISTLLESDIDHYKNEDLNSWMYLRFRSLIELDPNFLRAYRFGGKYLSIVKDDLEGAKEIFELGLLRFPHDYQLNFDAGFLYGFELADYRKAKEHFSEAAKNPSAPFFLKSLVLKMGFEESQNKETTLLLLKELDKTLEEDSILKHRVQTDIYSLQAMIDLECLNTGREDCRTIDANGDRYILQDGKFKSLIDFDEYGMKKREASND